MGLCPGGSGLNSSGDEGSRFRVQFRIQARGKGS